VGGDGGDCTFGVSGIKCNVNSTVCTTTDASDCADCTFVCNVVTSQRPALSGSTPLAPCGAAGTGDM
jgi:hypothetical protein